MAAGRSWCKEITEMLAALVACNSAKYGRSNDRGKKRGCAGCGGSMAVTIVFCYIVLHCSVSYRIVFLFYRRVLHSGNERKKVIETVTEKVANRKDIAMKAVMTSMRIAQKEGDYNDSHCDEIQRQERFT